MTLKELWESKGMNPTQVAGAAGLSIPTLYALNRRDPTVRPRNIVAVCKALGISATQYAKLEACPHADRYRKDADAPDV